MKMKYEELFRSVWLNYPLEIDEYGVENNYLNKQQENLIKNKETLALETDKHLKVLHNEKRKISIATRIPLEDIHVVKGVDTIDDFNSSGINPITKKQAPKNPSEVQKALAVLDLLQNK